MAGAHPLQPERSACDDRARRSELGFGLIEIVIVLVIIAILIVAALLGTRSSRTASERATALAAARSVGNAVDDFRKDHGGRPPVLGNARDWPAPLTEGPRSDYTKQRYIRDGSPDALRRGLATISASATSATRWTIHYTAVASPPGWRIVLRDGRNIVPPCQIVGGTPPPGPTVTPC